MGPDGVCLANPSLKEIERPETDEKNEFGDDTDDTGADLIAEDRKWYWEGGAAKGRQALQGALHTCCIMG